MMTNSWDNRIMSGFVINRCMIVLLNVPASSHQVSNDRDLCPMPFDCSVTYCPYYVLRFRFVFFFDDRIRSTIVQR